MNALLIMILSFAGYLIMYNLYGRHIGKKIFNRTRFFFFLIVFLEL